MTMYRKWCLCSLQYPSTAMLFFFIVGDHSIPSFFFCEGGKMGMPKLKSMSV